MAAELINFANMSLDMVNEKRREKKYVLVDIEATGKTPGTYSMIALGACIVRNSDSRFYREIKPVNRNYLHESIRIGCMGLDCLRRFRHMDDMDPCKDSFNPEKALDVLEEYGEYPRIAMADYAEWVRKHTEGYRPFEAAIPIKFDGSFTSHYFHHYYDGDNPFEHTGEDVNSMFRGYKMDPNAHVADLGIRLDALPHNALEDAVIQAREFERVLDLMERTRSIIDSVDIARVIDLIKSGNSEAAVKHISQLQQAIDLIKGGK